MFLENKKGDLHHLQPCNIIKSNTFLEFDVNTRKNLGNF